MQIIILRMTTSRRQSKKNRIQSTSKTKNMKGEFKDYITVLDIKRREYYQIVESADIDNMTDQQKKELVYQLRVITTKMSVLVKEIQGEIDTLDYNGRYIQQCYLADNMPSSFAIENLLLGKA